MLGSYPAPLSPGQYSFEESRGPIIRTYVTLRGPQHVAAELERGARSCVRVCTFGAVQEFNSRLLWLQSHAALAVGLGTTDTCANNVDTEPLSDPHVSRLFARVLATTTKICIAGSSSPDHSETFNAYRHAHPTRRHIGPSPGGGPSLAFRKLCADGIASGESFSAIHFQGCQLRQD